MIIKRMWIDQPSTSQPLHHLNGTRVLAYPEYANTYRIYFLSGDMISMLADRLWLSEGWPTPKAMTTTIRVHCPKEGCGDLLASLGEPFAKCRDCGAHRLAVRKDQI